MEQLIQEKRESRLSTSEELFPVTN